MGYGYDESLASMPPFMWVERHERVGDLGVIAFGAYNIFGLIGTEKGGVAIVHEDKKFVIATKDFPHDPAARAEEVKRLLVSKALKERAPQRIMDALGAAGYDVRSAA